MTDMELSFITSPERAERLARRPSDAVSVRLKRERFDALGLGCGLADQRDAVMNIDGRERLWRLVRADYDLTDPAVVNTAWVPAPDTTPFDGEGRD